MNSRRLACVILLVLTVPVGLAVRMAPLHLSPFVTKYGGSALWAIALYWLLAVLFPRLTSVKLAILAALAAALLELSRLFHSHATDAFRLTLPGRLLLGRFFSFKNIVAYWLAIALIAAFDHRFSHSRTSNPV